MAGRGKSWTAARGCAGDIEAAARGYVGSDGDAEATAHGCAGEVAGGVEVAVGGALEGAGVVKLAPIVTLDRLDFAPKLCENKSKENRQGGKSVRLEA